MLVEFFFCLYMDQAVSEAEQEKELSSGHFLRIRQWGGGGHLQKGTILYRVWRNDRWFVGNKKFRVVWHLIVGGGGGGGLRVFSPRKCLYFCTPMTAIPCIF